MIKIIRYWIIKTIGISKGEANALIILAPVLLTIIILPRYFHRYYTSTYSNQLSDQLILDSLVAQIESNKKKAEAPTGIIHYKKFDPNTASFDLLKSNGIPVHLAQRIISYREKGGQFRKKEDLIKIYGMNDELYATLSPHISIPPTKTYVKTKPSNHEFKKKHIITAFDINTADTSAFKQIRGVGTTLSNRIVKFRDQLGGFISTNQLNQVYGLEPEVIDSILSYGSISSDFTPMQVNINTDTIRHLSQHPFINYRLAKAVVNYRRQHGKFKELDQLKKIHLLDDSTYNKIQPYLIIGK